MPLTDARCRSEKPGETRKKLSDGQGLQLWVQPNGRKLWQLVYQFQGNQKQIALGPYPDVPLSEARDLREQARKALRNGKDPAAQRPSKALPATPDLGSGETFGEVAAEYLEKRRRENLAGVTMTKKEWLIDLALPGLDLAIREAQHSHSRGGDVVVCVEQPDGHYTMAWPS